MVVFSFAVLLFIFVISFWVPLLLLSCVLLGEKIILVYYCNLLLALFLYVFSLSVIGFCRDYNM